MKKQKSSSNLYCQNHKSAIPFEKRFLEYKFLRNKYPDDIPVIVVVVNENRTTTPYKVLASSDKKLPHVLDELEDIVGTCNQFSIETRDKSYKLEDINTDNVVDVYRKCKDTDGFLYIVAC
jgi:hypothetical protein